MSVDRVIPTSLLSYRTSVEQQVKWKEKKKKTSELCACYAEVNKISTIPNS